MGSMNAAWDHRSRTTASAATLRLARTAWRLQYRDSARSLALAEKALARATAIGDTAAEAWARLARGFHRMRYVAPAEAAGELEHAQRCFEAIGERGGGILAAVGIARCDWMQSRYRASLERLLPLRDEGMRVLRHEARGMLLNGIAGCYSAQGDSAQAFAYMYEALRETRPVRGHGFDVVLYSNLAHELYQLGEYDEALAYLQEGIDRCRGLANPRIDSVLHINRVVCLTDLGRPREALPDIEHLLSMAPDRDGRGVEGASFETMAIAALRAGEIALGASLVEQARSCIAASTVPDERVEGAVAEAELLAARGDARAAAARLRAELPLPEEGLNLRVHCLYRLSLADVLEGLGEHAAALRELRAWQQLQVERMRRAEQSRRQAAQLKTELLRLQRERDLIDQRRRASERAQGQLASINRQLSQKIEEVEALRAALQQQATRDFLTGLFNRRHLSDVLPSMRALAGREDQPLAVAVIDLDHFKTVNDRHGHLAGDRLLAEFGRLLTKRLRRSDVACRYGGEEFCLLMPRTDARSAARKLTALLRQWRAETFAFDNIVLSGNSFSAGVADSMLVPKSTEELLRAADRCVLEAKRLGRGRVVDFGAETRPTGSAAEPLIRPRPTSPAA
jgi:diguanylate cyclase (GGDEF)-like protein